MIPFGSNIDITFLVHLSNHLIKMIVTLIIIENMDIQTRMYLSSSISFNQLRSKTNARDNRLTFLGNHAFAEKTIKKNLLSSAKSLIFNTILKLYSIPINSKYDNVIILYSNNIMKQKEVYRIKPLD